MNRNLFSDAKATILFLSFSAKSPFESSNNTASQKLNYGESSQVSIFKKLGKLETVRLIAF